MFRWETDFSKLSYLDDVIFLTKRGIILSGVVVSEYDYDDNFSGYYIEDADHDHFYADDILCYCLIQDLIVFVPPEIKDKIQTLSKQ